MLKLFYYALVLMKHNISGENCPKQNTFDKFSLIRCCKFRFIKVMSIYSGIIKKLAIYTT